MNTMFPGWPNYTGPTSGLFALLHHRGLIEYSHNVMERIAYIQREKPQHEIAIRLHNILYLGGCPAAAQCATLDDDYVAELVKAATEPNYKDKYDALYIAYMTKRAPLEAEIISYIRSYIPDCAWNGETLVFGGGA